MRSRVVTACALVVALAATPSPQPLTPGDAAFANGDFLGAADAYGAELLRSRQDAHALLRLGEIALYANDLKDAEEAFQAIPATAPEATIATRQLAEVARRRAELAKRTEIVGGESDTPFIAVDPLPTLHVRVNGVDAIFFIDTGAPDIVLDPAFASSLHLSVTDAGIGSFAGGRTAALQRTSVAEVDVGTARAYDVAAAVLPTRGMAMGAGVRIDGILGTGFFERFLATIDYPHARLVLRPRDAATSQRFESDAQRFGATIVPCWLVGDHFVFARARVNDAPDGLFLFDSGLAGGGLMPSASLVAAAHITLDTAHASTGVGGAGAVSFVPLVAQSIAVGNAIQHDVPGAYTPQGSPLSVFPFAVQGAISHLFLKHYAYTVDFTAMQLVLAPAT